MEAYTKKIQTYRYPNRMGGTRAIIAMLDDETIANLYNPCFPRPRKLTQRLLAAGGRIWDPELKKMTLYRDLIKHSNPIIQQRWIKGGEKEFGRLTQGYKEEQGMDVLEWIHYNKIPKHKKVTYASYTVAFRPEKEDKWRVRITAGEDQLICHGVVTTQVQCCCVARLYVCELP